jgi:thiamine-monophosphate kinase
MLSEFDLIRRFFTRDIQHDARIALGIGDDCALLNPSPGMQLAISSDMLVEGRHFFPHADPYLLGHKCLAVNLSDMAAMGAKPFAFTLALALPEANPAWLQSFSQGLLALADEHRCSLVGGDTTKGPLTISITIFGEVPPGQALRRDAAQVGDDVWVSGSLGDARLALAAYLGETTLDSALHKTAAARMHRPMPRIALGLALRGIAHAALDVSDGLAGDLEHILASSKVGASVFLDRLPAGDVLQHRTPDVRRAFTLCGGDDYELCFTAPPVHREKVMAAGSASATAVTRIGFIEAQMGLRLLDNQRSLVDFPINSFDHFLSS